MKQVDAVEARISLDLRVGAAFTRLTTMSLQNRVAGLTDKVISYGGFSVRHVLTMQGHASSLRSALWLTSTSAFRHSCQSRFGTLLCRSRMRETMGAIHQKCLLPGGEVICSICHLRCSCTSSA